jgi:FMN phosphatase YigB (HAD superfamily)
MFVGDKINKDIKATAKIGMKAVLKAAYTNAGEKTPKGAWKINQLSELPELIQKINADSSQLS